MPQPTWHLDRRTFLRGAGLMLPLPWLEAMANADQPAERPKRFCAFYFPYGVACSQWFPRTAGADYQLSPSLEPLAPHKSDISVFAGLSHPRSREIVGHFVGDAWLTGAGFRTSYENSISLDQMIAHRLAAKTRIPSLVMSTMGGVGSRPRSTTISFDSSGRAMPAESVPKQIFERLFEAPNEGDRAARARALASDRRRVDFLLEDSRSLRNNLGRPDQRRLDEFLQSLSEVETRLARSEEWLGRVLPRVDRSRVNLEASPNGPADYLRTILDLIVLAFETDTTRVATYQLGDETADGGLAGRFPILLGIGNRTHHDLSHTMQDPNGARYDRWLAEQLTYFLNRLSSIREGDARLLDNTMILYGCSTSVVHEARNYPTILAGGKNLGLRHGRSFKQPRNEGNRNERPLGDLFLTMLHRFDIPARSFADNAGEFTEILRD
jgi:hypothetical protein